MMLALLLYADAIGERILDLARSPRSLSWPGRG
jgi:hypothetical protein